MNNFRNLYKTFQETRKAAREQATVAVLGDSPEAEELAREIGARRDMKSAEIILDVSGGKLRASGKAVDEPGEIDAEVSGFTKNDNGTVDGPLPKRIVGAIDDDYRVPLAKAYPFFRRAVCNDLIHKNARQNALIGAIPIPGADMPAMTANQGRMVLFIAAAHGEELSLDRARELLGVLAAGFGLRALTRQVIKIIPIGGWAAAAAVGYAGTLAMGRATMLYFERGHQKVGEGEMRDIRERAVREAKEFVSRFRDRKK
ncbi:MAG: YcjF family protein [Rubrobacteraceae bacterium]